MWQKLIVVYYPLIAELILKYRCVRFQKIAYFIGVYKTVARLSMFVPLSRTIFSIAINYQAILNLKKQYEGKEIELVEELNYILEDRQNVVNSFIDNSYVRFDKNLSNVYFDGVKQEVYRKAQLSQLLSGIMSAIYYRTPKIVNDLINKNQISATIKNARNKILTAILMGNFKKDMGLIGNGPELNILRSALVIPGVFINTDDEPHLEIECDDKKIRQILAEIRTHIHKRSCCSM